MFATILRRWRIATPLVTLATIITVVGGMAMNTASAHTIESAAFKGRAIGEVITSNFPHVADCDTGNLVKHGGSQELESDTGALSSGDDDGATLFFADQCNAEVVSALHKHSASVNSTVTLLDVAIGDGDVEEIETLTATANATCKNSHTHKSWSTFFSDEDNGDGFVEVFGNEIAVTGQQNQQVSVIKGGEEVTVIFNEVTTTKNSISVTALHFIESDPVTTDITDEAFVGNALAGVKCDA